MRGTFMFDIFRSLRMDKSHMAPLCPADNVKSAGVFSHIDADKNRKLTDNMSSLCIALEFAQSYA